MSEAISEVSTSDIPFTNMSYGQGHKSSKSQDVPTSTKNQVSAVMLFGVPIVSLVMDGKERLCLAQISSTLLSEFSYNEIHNRRVALGITCIQCTPVQLEILRRAGAMPVTSRRCGMITRREAERLCQSFLGDHAPPQLPENFAFDVYHMCAWGCRGNFVPSRYNSSRAKCIRCSFCQLFFSPNKFIFHSHRHSDSRYVQPDAANFNSWRRHLRLCGDPPEDVSSLSPSLLKQSTPSSEGIAQSSQYPPKNSINPSSNCSTSDDAMATAQIVHAWEDVKAMFNGGTRKRLLAAHSIPTPHSIKRSSPPKMSPGGGSSMGNGGFDPSKGSTKADPSARQATLHPGNVQLGIQHEGYSSGLSSPIQGTTPFLSPGRIWNPGVSGTNEKGRPVDGTPMHSLPLTIHPLSIPWLRRPLFPFSHPFDQNCKYLGEGSIFPEAMPVPTTNNRFPISSAFKPVRQQSNAAVEQVFSSWLNTSTLHGNFVQIPEDLSLSSLNSSCANSTSPNILQATSPRINESSKWSHSKDPKGSSSLHQSPENQNEHHRNPQTNQRSDKSGVRDEATCSSDEETTVDVESTDSEEKLETFFPSLKNCDSIKQKTGTSRQVIEVIESDEIDVESDEEVDMNEKICKDGASTKGQHFSNINSTGVRAHKGKKRLWDFDTRRASSKSK